MPKESFLLGDVRLGVRPRRSSIPSDSDRPFRIGVLGDFRGRAWTGAAGMEKLTERSPIHVDRDNFDDVLAKLGVQCDASVGDAENHVVRLQFQCLDDFRPDRLFQTVPVFGRFRQLREDLLEPSTYESAAAEVRAWGLLKDSDRESSPAPEEPIPEELPPASGGDGNLLDDIIYQTQQGRSTNGEPDWSTELNDFVRHTVEPYTVPQPGADQADLVACVDALAGQVMRSILHDPRFQALEAAWRGLAFLVRGLATGTELNISLLDVSLPELATDIGSVANVESSGIYKLLVEQTVDTPGAEPWSVLVGNYLFDAESLDLLVAGCLAKIAARAGAPLIAAASPGLFGCQSLADTPHADNWHRALPDKVGKMWATVRALPEAGYLGLVCPRFLLRLPYGRESWPIDAFDFEELPYPEEHECYLWGNPAFACAYLLGQAFEHDGWQMRPGMNQEIHNMPLAVYDSGGGSEIKPPAEVLLTEGAIERIRGAGVMPLLASRNSDVIRLAYWQSVASPSRPLGGRWS